MKKIIKTGFLLALPALLAAGCQGLDSNYSTPAPLKPVVEADFVPSLVSRIYTIDEVKQLYRNNNSAIKSLDINTDIVTRGTVVSSDQEGNFYRSFFIEDATGGIEVKAGVAGLYLTYPMGMTVYVNLNSLTLGAYGNMISIGTRVQQPTIGPIVSFENGYEDVKPWIAETIFAGEISNGPPVPKELTAYSQLTTTSPLLGSLVTVKNVTFKKDPLLSTWAVPIDPTDPDSKAVYGVHNLNFGVLAENVQVRTSGYSKFAGRSIEQYEGKQVEVTGVLTIFNTTYQLAINTDRDIKIVNP